MERIFGTLRFAVTSQHTRLAMFAGEKRTLWIV